MVFKGEEVEIYSARMFAVLRTIHHESGCPRSFPDHRGRWSPPCRAGPVQTFGPRHV